MPAAESNRRTAISGSVSLERILDIIRLRSGGTADAPRGVLRPRSSLRFLGWRIPGGVTGRDRGLSEYDQDVPSSNSVQVGSWGPAQ